MKPLLRQLLLLLPLLAALGARAQSTIQQEGFAGTPGTSASQVDAANTTSYTTTVTGTAGNSVATKQYFVRTLNGNPPTDATPGTPDATIGFTPTTGVPAGGTFPTTDNYFWSGEAVQGPANVNNRTPGIVQLNSVSITGYTNLQVKVGLFTARTETTRWEKEDKFEVQVSFNGSSTWNTVGRIMGDNTDNSADPNASGQWRQDADLDGSSADDVATGSPVVGTPMSDFTFPITGSGSTIRVRIMVTENGLSEEFAFDNIRLIGTVNSSAPPVLANLETATLNYAEGAGAVQITNSITVSDPDNTTLSGALVRLLNFDATEDELLFTNQNGITASAFNTSTGTLTLSGTATLGAYQTALRSIQYRDNDAADARDGTRTVQFSVTDASGAGSTIVTRDILVTSSLDAASTPNYLDDLTTNGEGTRYKSNTFFVANSGIAFFRTNIPNNEANGPFHSSGVAATTFTNISNSYYWYSAGTGLSANPSTPKVGTFITKQINAASYANLHFKILLGATIDSWEVGDYSKFYYRLNGGSWTIFASFRSTDQVTTTNSSTGDLAQDANPNNLGSAPTGTVLGPALQQFDFTLPAAVNGQQVDFMIESLTNDSNNNGEVFVFDKIEVTGLPQTTVNSIVRASANPTNAATVNYTVTFGAPVTGLTAANFSLTTTGLSGASVGTPVSTGTGSTWTVPVNTGTGSGTLTLNLANDTNLSTDITNTLPFAGETYTIDKTAPTATISRQSPTGTATNATAVTFRVTFTEAVTGVSTGSFTLNTTGTAVGTLASVTAVSTSIYDVAVSSVSGNGTLGITLKSTGSGVADAAGNAATGVAGPTYTIDQVAPTVTFTTTPPNPTNSPNATFTFTGSDGTGSGVASFQASLNSGAYVAVTSPLTYSGLSNGTYTVQVRAIDNAGNVGTPVAYTFVVDTTAPTVTISSTLGASGATTSTTPLTFSATFSEAVTGFLAGDISVTNGTVASGPTGSGSGPYTFTVTPTTAGTVTNVTIAANAAQDAAGNGSVASASYSLTYTLPAVAPTVTTSAPTSITGTSAVLGGNVTASGGANVTERGVVYVAGTSTPTTSDTKVPNGNGIGSFSQNISGLRGNTTYTVRAYAINSVGTAYGANQAFTTPNNPPTANADAVTVAEDSAPTVINVLANDNTLPDVGETLLITSTTQPANGTVTINGGTTVSFAPALNFNGTTTFTYTIADGNGGTATATVTVTVTPVNDAPVVTTTVGNTTFTQGAGAVAVDNGLTVTDVDNTTLASATVSIGTGFVSGQDVLSVTVSNGVSGTYTFATGVLMLSGTATVAQYQAILRSVTYNNSSATPNTATRTLNFTANDGSLTSAVATKNVSFQATTTVVSITQNGPSPTNASTVAYTVTFANAVTGVSASNFAVGTTNLTGASVASVTGSGASYIVTLNTGTLANPSAAGSIQLQFNNGIGISPAVTNPGITGPAYTIDRTAPTATISSSAGASGSSTGTAPIPFTVTFSESVTGFSAAGITVSNGAVTTGSFSGSGTTYTFTVTPAASGLVTVSVPANAAQDAATNGNTAASPFNITYTQPVTAAPVLTTPANNSRVNTLRPTYAGTAPAGSTVTVYVDGLSIGTTTATGGSFSLTQPTNLTEAQHTVYATAQTSGSTVSANSNTSTFTVDATAPTVVSFNRQSPAANPTNATSLTYRITFSEAVTGVTANDFSLTSTGTASGTVSAVASVSASVYDVTVTSASGNGTLRLDLNSTGTGIADLAANPVGGGYTSGQPYTLDNTAPTATISTTAASPTSTSPIPFTVTFSEAVTGFSASGISVTNGTITTAITNAGNAYSFGVTPTANGTVTVSVLANAAQDAAGNGNAASNSVSLAYAAPITTTTWTGTISPDWYTAGNWTGGVPTTTIDATIPNGTVFSPLINAGTATTRNLTINSGATLRQTGGTLDVRGNLTNNGLFGPTGGTVALGTTTTANIFGSSAIRFWNLTVNASGVQLSTSIGASVRQVLTLTGSFATQGNVFTLESSSTGDALVVNNSGEVVGTATVQRAIDPSVNPGLGYRHYSAPVSNSTIADLATTATGGNFTPVVNPAYNTSATPAAERPFPTVFGYDDSRLNLTNNLSSFDKGFFSPASTTTPLAVGRGYTVNIAPSEVVDFQGTLNNGDRTLSLTSNRATYPEGGWQLLGNPYPAPLNFALVDANDRLGLEGAIYVYTSTSQYIGRYRTYINGIGNPVLPIGQGFFARVATGQTSATMTFRNRQRLTAPNATAFQRTTADLRPLVQLTLQGTGTALADEAYVYFEQGASSSFEPAFDAEKLPNPTGLNLSTSLADGHQLSIDGQPELGTARRVVPLAVGVPTPGVYTFTASQLLNLSTVPVYLRDVQLGTLTDLRQQPTYQFTVSNAAALNTTRFELVFSPQQPLATVPAALAQQVALYPNPAHTACTIELPASLGRQPVTAALVDALGRTVRTQVLPAGLGAHSLLLNNLATGLYSLRLTTEAGIVVKKLVVE